MNQIQTTKNNKVSEHKVSEHKSAAFTMAGSSDRQQKEAMHLIQSLQNYMLTNKQMIKCIKNCILPEPKKRDNTKPKQQVSSQKFIVPHQKDSLFWLFYMFWKGLDTYKLLGSHTYAEEKKCKIECIQRIRNSKSLLKLHQYKKLSTCEDELLNQETIGLKTFCALCVIENIHIRIVFRRMIFTLFQEDNHEDIQYTIHRVQQVYGYEEYDVTTMDAIMPSKYEFTNIEKPLYAIGNYSSGQLLEIAPFFHVDIKNQSGKSKTKQNIYNEVCESIHTQMNTTSV